MNKNTMQDFMEDINGTPRFQSKEEIGEFLEKKYEEAENDPEYEKILGEITEK